MSTLKTTNVEAINIQHPSASASNIQLAADGTVVNNITFNVESGTSYTLDLTDNGKLLRFTSASATTVTVPLDSSVAFPIGAVIALVQYGAGTLAVQGASGVTVNSVAGSASASLTAQYSGAQLYKIATNEWILIGSVE